MNKYLTKLAATKKKPQVKPKNIIKRNDSMVKLKKKNVHQSKV